MRGRQATGKERRKTALYVLLTIVAIAVTGAALPDFLGTIGLIVWLIVVIPGSLLLLVRRHASCTAYRCSSCGHDFEISTLTDLISPHVLGKKYLKCRLCGQRGWARVLVKDD